MSRKYFYVNLAWGTLICTVIACIDNQSIFLLSKLYSAGSTCTHTNTFQGWVREAAEIESFG